MILSFKCSPDTTASVMTTHNNVFDFQVLNCILNYCQSINIRQWCLVRNVSVDEKLSRLKSNNFIGWNSWIWASNPKVLRGLNSFELFKEIRISFLCFLWPNKIVFHDSLEIVHDDVWISHWFNIINRDSGRKSRLRKRLSILIRILIMILLLCDTEAFPSFNWCFSKGLISLQNNVFSVRNFWFFHDKLFCNYKCQC